MFKYKHIFKDIFRWHKKVWGHCPGISYRG